MNNKKLMFKTLLSLVLFLFISSMAYGQTTLCGDVNCDGNVTIIDALMVAQFYVGARDELNCCETPTPSPSTTPTPITVLGMTFPYSPYSYSYGLGSVSEDQAADNDFIGNICSEYDLWKEKYITADGASGFLRVKMPNDEVINSTTSNAIGYGMLLSVYMDNPSLFENLWNYAQLYFDGNGLMHWRVTPKGSISGAGSTSDADIDMATALVFANKKWGLYENDAITMCDMILAHDVNPSSYLLEPGDSWGGTYNPSYFAPASMKIFADFTGDLNWLSVANKCYELLEDAAHPETGLVPQWCDADGNPGGGPGTPYPNQYYFDAYRTPMRIAIDYLWHGEFRARNFCTKIANFFFDSTGGDVTKISNGYHLDGTIIQSPETTEDAAFTGAAGAAGMAAGLPQFTQDILERTKELEWYWIEARGGFCYMARNDFRQNTARLLHLLLLTGNYPNLYTRYDDPILIPEPTPERTNPCPANRPPDCPEASPTNPPDPCPQDNLITNGCFDEPVSYPWYLQYADGLGGSMKNQDGVLYIDVYDVDPGFVQLQTFFSNLILDQTYVLSFDARTQWPGTIMIDIQQGSYPNNSFIGDPVLINGILNESTGRQTIEIDCEWEPYTVEFTNRLQTVPSASIPIYFMMGMDGGDMYFDNIILKPVQ